jgi:hypothetical protein
MTQRISKKTTEIKVQCRNGEGSDVFAVHAFYRSSGLSKYWEHQIITRHGGVYPQMIVVTTDFVRAQINALENFLYLDESDVQFYRSE